MGASNVKINLPESTDLSPLLYWLCTELNYVQECIPVGCVPAARWPYAAVCFPGGCLVRGGAAWSRGGICSGGSAPGGVPGPGGIPACTEADTLPFLPRGQNSWHTLVKILPWPNFVAAAKNDRRNIIRVDVINCAWCLQHFPLKHSIHNVTTTLVTRNHCQQNKHTTRC